MTLAKKGRPLVKITFKNIFGRINSLFSKFPKSEGKSDNEDLSYRELNQRLQDGNVVFEEHRKKAQEQIKNGSRTTNHKIKL